ncbi:uncharacterized protein LOC121422851 [Lytechinus variegatus]|uniref:uncharacterized protein LOC121422851 n=1 Tax=Lytechinus variegatus TaxID=7654 RepID=UPI001BB2588B|nr:uncharacterized protein LOC121422851 [Lytechinus variegatus]
MIKVHGTLISFVGDSLAVHDILGFLSPSARKLCRLCLVTREEIQTNFSDEDFQLREMEEHDELSQIAADRGRGDSDSGIRGVCPLNVLSSFHCVNNFNFDVMHDLLEGVCQYEIKLILNQLLFVDQFMTLSEFNQRISSFHYSFNDKKNKPTCLSMERIRNIQDHKLGEKASQMWCLTRMLPLLIGDRIPQDNLHYEILLLLLQCLDIIYSPVVSIPQTVILKHMIIDHHSHFKLVFPKSRMINKHHHMVHYPMCMRMCGPLVLSQCLRFEIKHNFGKRLAAINCNFRNICKSVAVKHQVMQCAGWMGKGLREDLECISGSVVTVSSLEGSQSIIESLHLHEDSEIFAASKVTVYGIEYIPNMYLVTGIDDDDEPQFSRIVVILVPGTTAGEINFVVRRCYNSGFFRHYHAFCVQEMEMCAYSLVRLDDLIDHVPLTALSSYENNSRVYLCPRHSLIHHRE